MTKDPDKMSERELRAEVKRLRVAINRAGGLALQKASHEIIRQVLAETKLHD